MENVICEMVASWPAKETILKYDTFVIGEIFQRSFGKPLQYAPLRSWVRLICNALTLNAGGNGDRGRWGAL